AVSQLSQAFALYFVKTITYVPAELRAGAAAIAECALNPGSFETRSLGIVGARRLYLITAILSLYVVYAPNASGASGEGGRLFLSKGVDPVGKISPACSF